MKKSANKFIPFADEWEQEISKLPKIELITIIRHLQTGTSDKKLLRLNTLKEAQRQVEGIINDFSENIISKDEAIELLGEYTGRIMEIFWKNAIERIKANPELLK